jgi:hypothetical protein
MIPTHAGPSPGCRNRGPAEKWYKVSLSVRTCPATAPGPWTAVGHMAHVERSGRVAENLAGDEWSRIL